MSDGSQVGLFYAREASFGSGPPAATAFKTLRFISEGLKQNTVSAESDEISADRATKGIIRTSLSAIGSINFEFSYNTFDDFLAAAFGAAWTGGAQPQITNASLKPSFIIEKKFADIGVFHQYHGMMVDTFSIEIPAQGKIIGSFGFIGLNEDATDATVATITTPFAATTDPIMNATDNINTIKEGGVLFPGCVDRITLSANNNVRSQHCVGNLLATGQGLGKMQINGVFRAHYATRSLYEKKLDQTSSSLEWTMQDADGNKYIFFLPEIKYTDGQVVTGGANQEVVADLTFTAIRSTSGYMIRITKIDAAGPAPSGPVWVFFDGVTPDFIELAAPAGTYIDTAYPRMVCRFTLEGSTDSINMDVVSAGINGATVTMRIRRTTANKLEIRGFNGSQPRTTNLTYAIFAGTAPNIGCQSATDEITIIGAHNTGGVYYATGGLWIYVNGVLKEWLPNSNIGAKCTWSLSTSICIGNTWTGFNSTDWPFKGKMNEFRLWGLRTVASGQLESLDTPVALRGKRASTFGSYITVISIDTALRELRCDSAFPEVTAIQPGDIILIQATISVWVSNFVESKVDEGGGSMLLNLRFTPPAYAFEDTYVCVGQLAAESNVATVLDYQTTQPAADGQLNGVQPAIFFGGFQTVESWNAGENKGYLGNFSTGSVG